MITRFVGPLVLILATGLLSGLPTPAGQAATPPPVVGNDLRANATLTQYESTLADEQVTATVLPGDPALERIIEAESLLPEVQSTAQLSAPGSCCGIVRYGDQALTFGGGGTGDPGDFFTLAFDVPRDGRYEIAGAYTLDPSFAKFQLSVDGADVGPVVDLYSPVVTTEPRIRHGAVDLTAGRHEVTFTIVGANPASSVNKGYRISVDLLRLRQLPTESRLTLTPPNDAVVHGQVPVYGWSTDSADTLSLTVDGASVDGRAALADTATLVYEAEGIQSASIGFRDRLEVRGQTIPLASDVGTPGGPYATDWVDIPADLLAPGTNTITIATGTAPNETNGNKDDFTVRNVRLKLADGTVLTPAQGSRSFAVGDGCCPDPNSTKPTAVDFDFVVPRTSSGAARAFVWDTTEVSNGEHAVSLVTDGPQGRQEQTSVVLVDNEPPAFVSTSPAQDQRVKGRFTVDAVVDDGDGGGIKSVTATLDGEPVELPSTHFSDDLADGTHTLEFTATDAAGNVSTYTVTFTSVAEAPNPAEVISPEDGATDVPVQAKLRVRASDPAGDPLTVTFLKAGASSPAPDASFTGDSASEPPAALEPGGETALTADEVKAAATSDDVYAQTRTSDQFPFQRYDLKVKDAEDVNRIDVTWEGRVPTDREVVLSVFDVQAQAWTPVAMGRGEAVGDLTLVGSVDLSRALDGDVVHVLVQARDPFADIEGDESDGQLEDPASYDFALAWLTDTQYLSEGAVEGRPGFGEAYTAINQWIVANADSRKIVYTAHTGDLINNWISNNDTPEYVERARKEFQFASDAMDILEEAGMPYGVTPGNHDNKFGTTNELYNEYFPPSRYEAASQTADQPYYGGSWREGDNHNHYDLFEASGQKFVAVYLGFIAGQEEIDWADQVLEQYADRKAIFLTHEYLRPSMDPEGQGGALSDENARSQGQELFDEVVLPNENVFLTLSGHTHGVALNIKRDVGAEGRTVVEMLANYQFYQVAGERRVGHFRLLQFEVDASEVAVNTYSPVLDDHNADEFDTSNNRDYVPAADEFRVPVDLASRTTAFGTDSIGLAVRTNRVIGTDRVASGDEATTTWSGLDMGTRYNWYARTADDFGGVSESPVFTFTTCSASTVGEPIVIGDQNSGVADRLVSADCTTITDRIDADGAWKSHRAFVDHVDKVTAKLVTDGVITKRERAAIMKAAARSDVGK